jgi:hypothetical protein
VRRHWHALHNAWATYLASHLNQLLPPGYFAAPNVQPSLDIWQHPLNVGQPLPTLPLWLRGNVCLGVELESTYSRTCREQRISIDVS